MIFGESNSGAVIYPYGSKSLTLVKLNTQLLEKMASVFVSTVDSALFASIQNMLSESFPGIQVLQGLTSGDSPLSYLMLPTQHEIEFVPATEVIRINGYKNYSTFTLNNRRPVTVSKNLVQITLKLTHP